MENDKPEQTAVNDSGTGAASDTQLTQPGSPDVRALTLAGLIDEYTTHKASTYHKLRYHVRKNHDSLLRRLRDNQGRFALADIRASTLQIWYDEWSVDGKISMAHAFMASLRTMFGFGLLMLEEKECERLCITMNKLRFKQSPPREVWLTAPQVDAIRRAAREHFGWYSLALAQAFQFELMFRQKDIIGEWIPVTEPGESDVCFNGQKWLRGLRWEEIKDNMVLRHITSKKQKPIEVDALEMFEAGRQIADWSGAPWMQENPVTMLSSIPHIGKPHYYFHPWQYTSLCEDDNYTKNTCIWGGNGFVMPEPCPAPHLGPPDNRIHYASPTDDRGDVRSAAPMGFAGAVFRANAPGYVVARILEAAE